MSPASTKRAGIGGAIVVASMALLAMLTEDEGTRYVPYKDVAGIWTVCRGHTGPRVQPGRTYTKQECDELLVKDASVAGTAVLRCTKVPLNQNQYDAFVRFTFNVGASAYCGSTLVKKLNQHDYAGACAQLLRWNKARVSGALRPVQGLTNRRVSEYRLCMKPMTPPPAHTPAGAVRSAKNLA